MADVCPRVTIPGVGGGIFLLWGEDELVEMRESPYEAEQVLQALIAKFPSLLAGDQYSGGPRVAGFWLVARQQQAQRPASRATTGAKAVVSTSNTEMYEIPCRSRCSISRSTMASTVPIKK